MPYTLNSTPVKQNMIFTLISDPFNLPASVILSETNSAVNREINMKSIDLSNMKYSISGLNLINDEEQKENKNKLQLKWNVYPHNNSVNTINHAFIERNINPGKGNFAQPLKPINYINNFEPINSIDSIDLSQTIEPEQMIAPTKTIGFVKTGDRWNLELKNGQIGPYKTQKVLNQNKQFDDFGLVNQLDDSSSNISVIYNV